MNTIWMGCNNGVMVWCIINLVWVLLNIIYSYFGIPTFLQLLLIVQKLKKLQKCMQTTQVIRKHGFYPVVLCSIQ